MRVHRAREGSQGREASEQHSASAIMALAPMGPEASFFDALDRHRASLLAMVKKGAGETPARATRVPSRYSSQQATESRGRVLMAPRRAL